jgi:hypothetical protein
MNKLIGTQEDAAQMDRVQGAVISALGPFRDNTEAALIAGALMRIVRQLLRLYGSELQRGLIDASVLYLRGRDTMPEPREKDLRVLGFRAPGSDN